jgi:hypothetical protein
MRYAGSRAGVRQLERGQPITPRSCALSAEERAALRSELESEGFEVRTLGPTWWMAIRDGEIYAERPRELVQRLRLLRIIQGTRV